jgi:GAF domain-containing protein
VSIDSQESAGLRRSGFEMPAESAAVARIAAVLGELAAATSMDDIVVVVASHIRDAVQAAVSTLILRNGDQLEIVGQVGVDSEKADRWSSFGVADANPASEAARTRQPIVAATAEEVLSRYPAMAADTPRDRSVVNLPLRTPTTVLGVIGLTFEENWNPGPFELDFLMTCADACAQAMQRIQATHEAEQSARRLEFVARASVELATSLDYRTTLTNVAHLAVPELADWCAVDLLVDGQLTTLAVAHADPAKVAWAWRLVEQYPTDMSATGGAPKVVRTGVGELTSDITDEMLVAAARDEQHLQLSRELNLRSVMIVPLLARGRTLGTITLIRSAPSPNFVVADLAAAEDLGRRAGIAIDNARLYHDAANVAAELQRAVLPDELGELEGWQSAVYYRPDGHADVGGDFYDAVELPDGRLAVFVGDVMGHGIKAAASMAQVRAAIRAFVTVDPDPDAVLARLDAMFEHLHLDTLVSVVYAMVDKTGLVQLANAGHCPTLLVRADGTTEFVMNVPRPPLGAGPGATCIVSAMLAPGDVLLLYTDGLVERRDEPLDAGFARLADHARRLLGDDMAAGLSELVSDVAADDSRDDVAALAVRRID